MSLKDILTAVGGDLSEVTDNLKSTYYEAIIKQCGGTVDDLPDRLESTYLKRIAECVGGGGDDAQAVLDAIIDKSATEVTSNASKVGNYALYQNEKLASVSFPNATSIGDYALQGCYELASVNFPNAESVGMSAFSSCKILTKADFPKLKTISSQGFRACCSLVALILRSETPCTLGSTNAFIDCYHIKGTQNSSYNPNGDMDGYIYVPSALVSRYKNATNWSTYASQIRAIEDYPEICGG